MTGFLDDLMLFLGEAVLDMMMLALFPAALLEAVYEALAAWLLQLRRRRIRSGR